MDFLNKMGLTVLVVVLIVLFTLLFMSASNGDEVHHQGFWLTEQGEYTSIPSDFRG